ncbi:MAG: ATP-dependent DNA helicase RecQ [Saprospiraceae bacterium]|nr:ATP-dependent DNA helicase RecQ [Saprospiraceae bacterium]
MHEQLKELLKSYWGYDAFRSPQLEVIQHSLSGKDAIVLLPTGGGKSLCYQLPALVKKGLTLVVSPLISLMQDQVGQLKKRGIRAALLHSGLHSSEKKKILDEVVKHQYDLLYLSPERLRTPNFMDYLVSADLSLIAIDEAHCISQWGHDFRPSYLRVGILREHFPSIPILALTGTATSRVINDIEDHLQLRDPHIFRSGFERPNIFTVISQEDVKLPTVLHLVRQNRGSHIIYVRSRRTSVELAELLRQRGVSASAYHAGMESSERHSIQTKWINDRIQCIVATSAFGMGVDKPDVRLVIHFELPPSIEDYYQEIGRAGRDGQRSWAYLVYNERDRKNLIQRQMGTPLTKNDIQTVYQRLAVYLQVPADQIDESYHAFDLTAFSRHFEMDQSVVKESLRWLVEKEYIQVRTGGLLQSRVRITMNKHGLEDIMERSEIHRKIIKALLRTYEGLFSVLSPVDEARISEVTGLTPDVIVKELERLGKKGIIDYHKAVTGEAIRITGISEWSERLALDHQRYLANQKRKSKRAEEVLKFIDSDTCRTEWVLSYFDEKADDNCGHCDVCLGSKEPRLPLEEELKYRDRIFEILETEKLILPDLLRYFPIFKRRGLLQLVEEMVEDGEVVVKDATFMLPSRAS